MEPNEPLKDKRYSIRWEVSIWKNLTNSSPIVGDSLGYDMIRNEELIRSYQATMMWDTQSNRAYSRETLNVTESKQTVTECKCSK